MAKRRENILGKMEKIEKPTFTSKPHIHFTSIPNTAQVILEVNQLEVGYYYPLLPKMKFTVQDKEKLVITGFNGIGKSTLLKTLMGEIPAISGGFRFSDTIKKIGYYEQDLKWENPEDTPLNIISRAFPNMFQKQVRKHLADCAIKKEHFMQEISTLSGGEQAKVKLCKLTLTPCNILILDEPTNHLDMDTKEELKKALRDCDGTVILVSHEEAFYRDLATRVVSIEKLCI